MPIQKHLDLSTGHMKSTDDALLHELYGRPDSRVEGRSGNALYATPQGGAGWIISTSGYATGEDDAAEFEQSMIEEGFSREFVEVMRYAHENGCFLIHFDRDAPEEENLPMFDWGNNDAVVDPEADASAAPGM